MRGKNQSVQADTYDRVRDIAVKTEPEIKTRKGKAKIGTELETEGRTQK